MAFHLSRIPGLHLKMTEKRADGCFLCLSLSLSLSLDVSSLITLVKWIQLICHTSACCLLRRD